MSSEYLLAVVIVVVIVIVGFVAILLRESPAHSNKSKDALNKQFYLQYASIKQVYYHYTTAEAAEQIIRSGLLIHSDPKRSGDAFYGSGVYLTQMPPSAGKIEIALNNWDGGRGFADQIVRRGKVRAVIRLELNTHLVRKVHDPSGRNRDIYLYPDGKRVEREPGQGSGGAVSIRVKGRNPRWGKVFAPVEVFVLIPNGMLAEWCLIGLPSEVQVEETSTDVRSSIALNNSCCK